MRNRSRAEVENHSILHNQNTEPIPPGGLTTPIPIGAFPPESGGQRFLRGLGNCCKAIVRKINQMLAFALVILLLVLLARFLLHLFNVTTNVDLFTQWAFVVSDPLITPFDHLFTPILYKGYSIDGTTLMAMVVYTVSVVIVWQFLKLLVSRPK